MCFWLAYISVSWKGRHSSGNGKEKSSIKTFEMHTLNKMASKSVKEGRNVQETEAKHRVKSTLCEGKVAHREYDMIWRTTQMQHIKLFLFTVAHKVVSNATKHIELAVLKQKQIIRKASQRTHVHCFCSLPWQVITTKCTHNLERSVDGIAFTLAHRKNKLCAGPVPMWLKQIWCYTQGRAEHKQDKQ